MATESKQRNDHYKNFCQDRIGNLTRKGSGKTHTNDETCWCEPDCIAVDDGSKLFTHYQVTREFRKNTRRHKLFD